VKEKDIIDKVKEAAKRAEIKNIIVTKTEDYSLSPLGHEEEEGIIWFTDLIKKHPPNPPKVDIDVKKDVARLLFTGGMTGVSKACMYSHHNLIGQIVNVPGTLFPPYLLSLSEGLIRLHTMMLQSNIMRVYAIYQMHSGYTVLLQKDPRDYKEAIRLIKRYHPLVGLGAPVQHMKLMREEGTRYLGMFLMSSTTPLYEDVQKKIEKKTGTAMGQPYGPTEVGGTQSLPSTADLLLPILGTYERIGKVFHLMDRIFKTPGVLTLLKGSTRILMGLLGLKIMGDIVGTMLNGLMILVSSVTMTPSGREKEASLDSIGIPNVDVDIKILDLNTGEKIPISRVVKEKLRGELCVRAPGQMSGFWPDPGSGIDEEGFIHLGDVVTMDETGHIHVVDRIKDMAVVGGYNVYTGEINKLLISYQGVGEAATIGIPDPERPGSERIKVFIAPLPEYKGKIKEEDIINYLKGKVAPYAVPKFVEFRDRDKFPRATSGVDKILKRKLREEEIEKMKKEGLLK
jgi:acyl-CoA synthetase (AMP-forming)/AMP-acid ligase II